jgi:hypothetical protein
MGLEKRDPLEVSLKGDGVKDWAEADRLLRVREPLERAVGESRWRERGGERGREGERERER